MMFFEYIPFLSIDQNYLVTYSHVVIYCWLTILIILTLLSGFVKNLLKIISKNKLKIAILLVIGVTLSLNISQIEGLVTYDEHSYLISATNAISYGKNALCTHMQSNVCTDFGMAPHGLGASSIYSLVYSKDIQAHKLKISYMNLIFYLATSLVIFFMLCQLFGCRKSCVRWAAFVAALIFLASPHSILFSRNLMPSVMSAFFLALSVALLIYYMKTQNIYTLFASILSAIILSTIRIEYWLYLILLILFVLGSKDHLRINMNPWTISVGTILIFSGILSIIYAYNYSTYKISTGSYIGLQYLNAGYLQFFVQSIGMVVVSLLFLYSIIRIKSVSKKQKNMVLFFASTIIVFILFYSMYNFPPYYRYMVPLTTLFSLTAGIGILKLSETKHIRMIIMSFVTLVFILSSLPVAYEEVVNQSKQQDMGYLVILDDKNLRSIPGFEIEKDYIYSDGIYLGQLVGVRNFISDLKKTEDIIDSRSRIYFVDSIFRTINDTGLADKFSIEKIHEDTRFGTYNIYKIE